MRFTNFQSHLIELSLALEFVGVAPLDWDIGVLRGWRPAPLVRSTPASDAIEAIEISEYTFREKAPWPGVYTSVRMRHDRAHRQFRLAIESTPHSQALPVAAELVRACALLARERTATVELWLNGDGLAAQCTGTLTWDVVAELADDRTEIGMDPEFRRSAGGALSYFHVTRTEPWRFRFVAAPGSA